MTWIILSFGASFRLKVCAILRLVAEYFCMGVVIEDSLSKRIGNSWLLAFGLDSYNPLLKLLASYCGTTLFVYLYNKKNVYCC